MNVLVYSGPEVIQSSLADVLTTLRSILFPYYSVRTVSIQSLSSEPWTTACALLVFPPCRDLAIDSAMPIIKSIGQAFSQLNISTDNGLRFHDQARNCYLDPRSCGDNERHDIAIQFSGGETEILSKPDDRDFVGLEQAEDVLILAKHAGSEGKVTAAKYGIGEGKAAFWSPSIDVPVTEASAPSLAPEAIDLTESKRKDFIRTTLRSLGLRFSAADSPISRPLPQFLVSCKPSVVTQILHALAVPMPSSEQSVLEDSHDTFHFKPLSAGASILQESRSVADKTSDNSAKEPRHIIVCPNGQLPETQLTPLFDLALYFEALSSARKRADCVEVADSWGFGEALLYSEIVTSTQTMLDKNTRLLSSLPAPLLSLASHQLAGRGRGSNVWLSPSGSLAMSLLLRVPLSMISPVKLTFVQYLASLAMVEACREDTILGKWGTCIRLKWPNDIYAITGGAPTDRKKIGGVLVNCNFGAGNVEIVVGMGLNVSNPAPVTSLSQLLPQETATFQHLRIERIAATIMAKFERMWTVFLAHNGSFEPFVDLYVDRWLHTNEVVTLTTVTPAMRVRIVGITPDHGLLRTVAEQAERDASEKEYINLQPDGNSFDFMAGMIRTKT